MPHPQDQRPEFTPADQAGPTLDSGQDLSDVFNDTATTEIYTLSPHDALPI